MRYSLFLTALFFTGILSAQETASQEVFDSKLSLGFTGSLDYCHRSIYITDTSGLGFSYFRENEIPYYGFSTGIALSYKINDRISVEALPRYSLNRYRTKDILFVDQSGTQIGDGYITYSNKFISVPIGVQYHHSASKLGFVGGAYVVPEYAMGIWSRGHYNLPPTYDINDEPTKENLPELRSLMVSGMVNAGIEYRTGKLSLQALPQYKIGFLKQAADVPVNRRLWSAGIEIRVLYSV
jgi:hypothetical protein